MDKKMKELINAAAYLKGFAEGGGIDQESREGAVIVKLIDIIGKIADVSASNSEQLGRLQDSFEGVRDDLDIINEDLDDVYSQLDGLDCGEEKFGDTDIRSDSDQRGMNRLINRLAGDDGGEAFFDEEDEADDPDFFEIECPSCGEDVLIDFSDIEDDGDIICPNCGKAIELDIDCGCDEEDGEPHGGSGE